MRYLSFLFLCLFPLCTSCTMEGAITTIPDNKDNIEQPSDEDNGQNADNEDNEGGNDTFSYMIGEPLYNEEYDSGILLSDGTWDDTYKESGVAVFDCESLDEPLEVVYFKNIPQARVVQGWETVVAVAKDAEGNVLSVYESDEKELINAFWALPKGTATLYVQVYNLSVSEESGEVYRAFRKDN